LTESGENLIRDEYEYLRNLIFHEDKKFYDRANFFVVGQSMLFGAFATLVSGSKNLTGFYVAFPAVISLAGVLLNVIWVASSNKRTIYDLKQKLDLNRKSAGLTLASATVPAPTITDLIYKAAPLLLGFTWGSLFTLYLLQLFNIIAF
jgi:hypothetical protein